MKRTRSGIFMLGHDDVYRSFDDAVALSPTQIKQILDRMPWD
jgi:hypothetical protein